MCLGLCNFVELIDTIFTYVEGVDQNAGFYKWFLINQFAVSPTPTLCGLVLSKWFRKKSDREPQIVRLVGSGARPAHVQRSHLLPLRAIHARCAAAARVRAESAVRAIRAGRAARTVVPRSHAHDR
jgi:hypothetical protein